MPKPLLLVFCVFFPFLVCAQSKLYYVSWSATGLNDGSSWIHAFTDLNQALNSANSGDTIWVAVGTYYPSTISQREASFIQKSGVQLYGGFAGSETSLTQRNWEQNPVVLSGDIGMPGDSTDNSYNVLYMDYPDSTTVLDGFVLERGNANSDMPNLEGTEPLQSGSALYIMGAGWEAYPLIRHCRFEHNHADKYGGAVYINGFNNGSVGPMFLDCSFAYNDAGLSGGAVYQNASARINRSPDYGNCRFNGNTALKNGGALCLNDQAQPDPFQIWGCDFSGNNSSNGNSIFLNVGNNQGCDASVRHCNFEKNGLQFAGATVFITSLSFLYVHLIEMYDNTFYKNNAIGTAVVYFDIIGLDTNAIVSINHASFIENTVGGLYGIFKIVTVDARFEMKNTLFKKNHINGPLLNSEVFAPMLFSNMVVTENDSLTQGFLLPFTRNLRVENSVFTKNRFLKEFDGNVYFQIGAYKYVFTNCYFGKHGNNYLLSHPKYTEGQNHIKITNNVFEQNNNFSFTNGNGYPLNAFQMLHCMFFKQPSLSSGIYYDTGNLFGVNPMFRDSAQGDYSLLPCSPLLNAGLNIGFDSLSVDLLNNPRIQGGTVDIGPYEMTPPTLSALPVLHAGCESGNTGSIILPLTDGCAPYHFHWTSGTSTGDTLHGLAAGAYQITVTDARGFSNVLSAIMPAGQPLSLTPIAQPVVCGDTLGGSATAKMPGGTAPFTFKWDAYSGQDTLRTNLQAGTYPVTVTDALGCTAAGVVQVSTQSGLNFKVEVEKISCFGAMDGGLTLVPLNGKAPFSWQWNNGPSAPTYQGLSADVYGGSVTDALGCKFSWNLPIQQPSALDFVVLETPATDSLVADGRIQLDMVQGGTPPYQYLWSTGDSEPEIDHLAPGVYSVTVTDANDCTLTGGYLLGFTTNTNGIPDPVYGNIFPNPFQDQLSLDITTLESPALYMFCMYNTLDEKVFSANLTQKTNNFYLSKLSPGMYCWEVKRSGQTVSKGRLMKQ